MDQHKSALLLAAHGAARAQALVGVDNIIRLARERFPNAEVRMSFTSPVVRRLLKKRAAQGNVAEALKYRSALASLADLQEDGFEQIVVQSLHIFAGAEYVDLAETIRAMESIQSVYPARKPFKRLALGRPALGQPGPVHPYLDDLERAADALAGDLTAARQNCEALVYVGHGNRRFSSGIYQELQEVLRQKNPGQPIFVGTMDGVFSLDKAKRWLAHVGADKALVLPLLLVTGGHALDDICGTGTEAWAGALSAAGLEVRCRPRGLAELDSWAGLYLDNAADAAADAGISL